MKRRRLLVGLAAALFVSPIAAQAAPVLYGVTFTSNQLITIDTGTGAGTLVGALSSTMSAFGLGTRGTSLYTFDQVADRIRQLDPLTAATIGTVDIGIGAIIGEGALDFRSDGLGFLSSSAGSTGQLFSFDVVAGTSTPITPLGGLTPSLDGMAFQPGSDVLFGLSQFGEGLYTVNQVTGGTTLIGLTGISGGSLAGLAFLDATTLFAVLSGDLYSINVATGAASFIGATGFEDVSGLTFFEAAAAVPEPSTLVLIGGGMLALALARKRLS